MVTRLDGGTVAVVTVVPPPVEPEPEPVPPPEPDAAPLPDDAPPEGGVAPPSPEPPPPPPQAARAQASTLAASQLAVRKRGSGFMALRCQERAAAGRPLGGNMAGAPARAHIETRLR